MKMEFTKKDLLQVGLVLAGAGFTIGFVKGYLDDRKESKMVKEAEEFTIIYADDEDWVITKTKDISVRKVVRDIDTGRYHK